MRLPRSAQNRKSTANKTSGVTTPKAAMATMERSILIASTYFGGCSSAD
jgi:hypothetical protein